MPQKSNFCFWAMSQFDWPITQKKTMEAPQNRRFYGKIECLPLWSTYRGEKGRTLGKTHGIKERCYCERPWETHWEPKEHIGNLWEPIGNLKGICWDRRKNEKNPAPSNLKGKRSRHFECVLSLPIGCMKFLCSKTVGHHFWLASANTPIKNWGYLFILAGKKVG